MREKVRLELEDGPGLSVGLKKAHYDAMRGSGYEQKSRSWIQAWLYRVRVLKERNAEDPVLAGYRSQVNFMARWRLTGVGR
jgi:hypothetical protein